jgi:hypothetical protein
VQALKNVVLTYRDHKSSWEGLMKRGTLRDCKWENAAIQYEQLFMEPVLCHVSLETTHDFFFPSPSKVEQIFTMILFILSVERVHPFFYMVYYCCIMSTIRPKLSTHA